MGMIGRMGERKSATSTASTRIGRGTTTATTPTMTIQPFESVSDAMLEATSGGSFRQSWSRWAEDKGNAVGDAVGLNRSVGNANWCGAIAGSAAWAGGLVVDAVAHPGRVIDAMKPPKPRPVPPTTGAITG